MASSSSSSAILIVIMVMLFICGFVGTTEATSARKPDLVLTYYAHQQFRLNELGMVPAARPPVNGTVTGFGMEVVYEYPITVKYTSTSKSLGFVRGTSVVVNNTAASTTFLVNNVVHYDDGKKVKGVLTQQGEASFNSGNPWELAVVGGTCYFRDVYGYNVGRAVSVTRSPTGAKVLTFYKASLWFCK